MRDEPEVRRPSSFVRTAVATTLVIVGGYFIGALAGGNVADPVLCIAPAAALIGGATMLFIEIRWLLASKTGA